ncbi:putative Tigger transposable element-derived protein 1-like 264, partial [Homarus americanus]
VIAVHHDITGISKEASFEGVDKEDVADVLESHSEELSTKDLLLQEEQQMLSSAMDHVNTAMDLLAENDPNFNRSSVRALVERGMLCNRELYLLKEEAHQTTITSFFKPLSQPQPSTS